MLDIPAAKKPNPIDMSVGGRLRMRRKMLGMSQEKLAKGLGVTFQQIQKYEKGTNRIGASRLQTAATFLDVDVAYFFEGQTSAGGEAAPENEILSFLASAEGMQLNRAFAKIASARARRQILDIVRLVAGVAQPDDAVASEG